MRFKALWVTLLGAIQVLVVGAPMSAVLTWLLPLLMYFLILELRARRQFVPRLLDLGRGQAWTVRHSQALYAAEDPLIAWRSGGIFRPRIRVDRALLTRNILLIGAPGSGKTQMMLGLLRQLIARGESVILLDPKSAPSVAQSLRAEARGAKRAFMTLTVDSGQESVSYDPLRYCRTGFEVADRLMALMPSSEDSFKGFCRGVVVTLSEALWLKGERPTLKNLFSHWADAGEHLKARPNSNDFISEPIKQSAIEAALDRLVAHDRTHYQKLTASMLAMLSSLTTGALGDRLSPRSVAQWDCRRAIRQGGVLYVGLGMMGQPAMGQVLARLILADLAALAMVRLHEKQAKPLWVFVDEAGEIASPALIQILNKGRESGVHAVLAVQTLSDLEVSLEGRAAAEVVQGNCGTWVLFRQLDAASREISARRLGEVPVLDRSRNQALSEKRRLWANDSTRSRGIQEHKAWRPRIPPALFSAFRDRESLVHLPDGRLFRITVPLLS